MSDTTRRRLDLALFAAALLFLAAALVRQLAVAAPLGHDEAIYAGGGRELLDGTPASGYGLHRSAGMRALAAAALLIGSSEWALRSIVVAMGLAFLIVYRALGARLLGRWPAAWASAAMVTSYGFQRRAGEILSDVPALLLMTLVLFLAVRELAPRAEGGRPGPALLAIAPIAAAAFYLRYGLSTSLVAVALAAATVWWRPLAAGRRVVAASLLVLLLLLLPHALYSVRETGSPFGIIQRSGDAAHRDYLAQGLVQFPAALLLEGGPLLAALVVLGAIHGARCMRRLRRQRRHGRPPPEERAIAFLWLASAIQILFTGFLAHAEFRYFFFGVSGLALVGAQAACSWAAARGRWLGWAAAAALLAAAAVTHGVNIHRYARLRRDRQVEVAAAALVRRAAGAESCAALSGEIPAVGWYSGCEVRSLGTQPRRLVAARRFLVLFGRDPESGRAAARLGHQYRLTPIGRAADAGDVYGDAAVYEIR